MYRYREDRAHAAGCTFPIADRFPLLSFDTPYFFEPPANRFMQNSDWDPSGSQLMTCRQAPPTLPRVQRGVTLSAARTPG
jgi:hypothetical protein